MGIFNFHFRANEKNSLIKPDFIAVDFETANSRRNSACAIGIATVKDLNVVDSYYSLLNPPGCRFSKKNIEIHGIRPQDVSNAPTLAGLWPNINRYFCGIPVVAHNAPFDMSVLKCSLGDAEEFIGDFEYVDTITMARKFLSGHHDLETCVDCLGLSLENHHNARADAIACAQIAIECIKMAGVNNLSDFCSELNVNSFLFSRMRNWEDPLQRYPEAVRPSEIQPCNTDFDCNHILYGKNVVFTGELSISRREAMQRAADVGAIIKSAVSSRTDYLVVGRQDPSLVGDDGMSTSQERAARLMDEGKASICVIGEYEFMHLLRNEGILI
ncbi:DNA polymerase III PolC-type [bioreactor metagenome]|uniref:DNA polymerase III PolC-type n=1 Tax=bioreactor metagenome TaxID=1076179 RepID=A0A644WVI7_9ZZZZ